MLTSIPYKGKISDDGPDARLPERLFATDRYPSRRLNVYSTLEYLLIVRDIVRGMPEMDLLLGSCFGKLFELPVRRCSYSSVMIHSMLARQMVTKKRYELWPVFGDNPMRLSMVKFGSVTGLPCEEFEDGYVVDFQPSYKEEDYAYWDRLIDRRRDITILDVVKMVTEDKKISRSRRLKLCLIIIVDGVLIASTQPARPTLKHVKRLESLKNFLAFQWGRECFYWTVSTMIPGKRKCDDPNGEFCSKLRQKTKKMVVLPLALQLAWGTDELKLIDCERLPQHTGLNLVDVLEAEHNHELVVQPMMEIGSEKPDGWGKWDDEINDRRVTYVLGLIEGGHKFKKSLWGGWGGGDAQEVLYNHEVRKAAKKRKRQGATSRTTAGEGPVWKQRRVSTYFRRPVLVDDDKHEELAARVAVLEKVVERMKRRLGRRKRKGITPRKELLASGTGLKKKKKKIVAVADKESSSDEEDEEAGDEPLEPSSTDGGRDDSEHECDVGAPNESSPPDSEDVGKGDANGQEPGSGCLKEESVEEDEEEEVDGSTTDKNESEAMEVEVEECSS
ncbi:hypothetical protein Bca52824_017830 [Brassica carinata]|uniref:DUF1985 domain-containing protein n=1 Tax=Brassica carinata TaxID=52824 RepID=A0A8X8AXV7_BRACI|nr:hypothetical protein Bca52824_017830 [Brassica carinata]